MGTDLTVVSDSLSIHNGTIGVSLSRFFLLSLSLSSLSSPSVLLSPVTHSLLYSVVAAAYSLPYFASPVLW